MQGKWDLSDYRPQTQHSRWANFGESDEPYSLSIFPKLFPVNEHDYSVAIIQRWFEGYSGGSLSEEVVDFLQLKKGGHYQQIFQNIPFSMERMIRACFSEEDYRMSHGQCHDEYQLSTQIRYIEPYVWQVKYHFQADFSPASDSGKNKVSLRKNYVLKENRKDVIQLPENWN